MAIPHDIELFRRGDRFVLGRGGDGDARFYGIWDSQSASQDPVQVFPATDAGWPVAWRDFSEREPGSVEVPEHERTPYGRVLLTTTVSLDGYQITRYVKVDSVEIVLGTGFLSEFTGDIADFAGGRATRLERKLSEAKDAAFRRLREVALESGGNAVVGIDLDYTMFSGNKIGLIVSGTIVLVEPFAGPAT